MDSTRWNVDESNMYIVCIPWQKLANTLKVLSDWAITYSGGSLASYRQNIARRKKFHNIYTCGQFHKNFVGVVNADIYILPYILTWQKSFMKLTPRANVIKLFTAVIYEFL